MNQFNDISEELINKLNTKELLMEEYRHINKILQGEDEFYRKVFLWILGGLGALVIFLTQISWNSLVALTGGGIVAFLAIVSNINRTKIVTRKKLILQNLLCKCEPRE